MFPPKSYIDKKLKFENTIKEYKTNHDLWLEDWAMTVDSLKLSGNEIQEMVRLYSQVMKKPIKEIVCCPDEQIDQLTKEWRDYEYSFYSKLLLHQLYKVGDTIFLEYCIRCRNNINNVQHVIRNINGINIECYECDYRFTFDQIWGIFEYQNYYIKDLFKFLESSIQYTLKHSNEALVVSKTETYSINFYKRNKFNWGKTLFYHILACQEELKPLQNIIPKNLSNWMLNYLFVLKF